MKIMGLWMMSEQKYGEDEVEPAFRVLLTEWAESSSNAENIIRLLATLQRLRGFTGFRLSGTVSRYRARREPSYSQLLERIEQLESEVEKLRLNRTAPRTSGDAGRDMSGESHTIDNVRGLLDLLAKRTFSHVEDVKVVCVCEDDDDMEYHIFVKEGCLGKAVRNLTQKALEIEDLFPHIAIDFRVHDSRALSVVGLDRMRLVFDKGEHESDDRESEQQVSTSSTCA